MSCRARRPLTLVRALKAGRWDAVSMSSQLDEDLLPECPFPGPSARYVWDNLRELQLAYQDRDPGWRDIPSEFERLARALPTVVALSRDGSTPEWRSVGWTAGALTATESRS